MSALHFPRLSEPVQIGKLTLKNRIVMAPMLTRYFAEDGSVTQRSIDYYTERARGGVALIIPEASYPCGRGYPGRLASYDDRFVPGMRKLARAVHVAGARIIQQLSPGRGVRSTEALDAASASTLTIPAIEEMVSQFGEGARRYREAGFDGVQIHGAHGYLIGNFLSRQTNNRSDAYGGELANRARFLLELIRVVKERAGKDFPVMVRLSLIDRLGYLTLEEGIRVCQLAEQAGADALDITSGVGPTIEWAIPPMSIPKGCNVPLAEEVKKSVNIPVGVVGGISDPYLAESILAEGKADFILVGRSFITDPRFPLKVFAGRVEDVRSCIRCMHCTDAVVTFGAPLTCTVNPECGQESHYRMKLARKVRKSRNILVVGSGCAGMEAARVAATRGHQVTIWEARDKLGGLLNIAALPPFKEELRSIISFYQRRLNELGVKIELGREATAEQATRAGFDAVIVSCGALPVSLEIPGIEQGHVVNAEQVLLGKTRVGARVAVLGGGLVGCEVAEFLADQGHKVTVLRRSERMATDAPSDARRLLLRRLRDKGVTLLPGIRYSQITREGLEITRDGKPLLIEADTIVTAAGYARNTQLYETLRKQTKEVYIIGDAAEPGSIFTAIGSGARTGLKI